MQAGSLCSTDSSIMKSPCADGVTNVWCRMHRASPTSWEITNMPVTKVLTAGIGECDLRDIAVYRQRGGYVQLARALTTMKSTDVLDAAEKSGLRGRGGAGFPTGKKWSFLPGQIPTRYLVCNCDEAEPGTFKDHMLLEETPHLVLEGILLGAYGIGSHHAFIYIRGEFKRGYEIFMKAVADARAAGFI